MRVNTTGNLKNNTIILLLFVILFFSKNTFSQNFWEQMNGPFEQYNYDLTTQYISSLAINSNDFVFAGTFYHGVFRSINPTTSIEYENNVVPTSFSLS